MRFRRVVVLGVGRDGVVSDREGDTTGSIARRWCEDTGEMGDGERGDVGLDASVKAEGNEEHEVDTLCVCDGVMV
jgi:hypothetical protein